MTLSRAHTYAKAAYVVKLLLLNKSWVTHPLTRRMAVLPVNRNPNRNPYSNPNVMRFKLSPKANDFFRGPCATFPLNFVQIVQ